jgi:hypothetical protein
MSLEHNDACKLGQGGLHVLPDPNRDIFRRGIVESLNIVQILMVEPLKQRLEGRFDGEEVSNKACDGIDLAFESEFYPVGVAVQPATAVLCGNIWQEVRRFETESLRDLHK